MSATFNLFGRWKQHKGFKSDNQAAIALGIPRQTVQNWKEGRNGEPEYIERMAHDLGEDPVKTILEAYAEQKKGASARVLVKLSKRFGAVVLAVVLFQGATANPIEINGLRDSTSHITPTMYIMYSYMCAVAYSILKLMDRLPPWQKTLTPHRA